MSYGAHLARATRIGTAMIGAGIACLVHGLVPSLFTTRASRTIISLHEEVSAHGRPAETERRWIEFEI